MPYSHGAALLLTVNMVCAQSTCWTRLQCTNPDCWLSVPCKSSTSSDAYKRDFCDDFGGSYKCNCKGKFSAADQQKYGTHQLAEKPICPPQTAAPVVPAPTPTCSSRLQCTDPTCWLSTPCNTGKLGNAAYKAAFCDDYGKNQKCSCSGRFTAAEQALYGTHQRAAKPVCPDAQPEPVVSGDPFTTDKDGNRVQFFLPVGRNVELLTCTAKWGGFQLLGRVMTSGIPGDHQQWFDHFVIRVDGEDKLFVSIRDSAKINVKTNDSKPVAIDHNNDVSKEGTSTTNSTKGQRLSMIDVKMELDNVVTPITESSEIAHDGIGIDVSQMLTPNGDIVESVNFEAAEVAVQIKTALASKFATKTLQKLYRHLDIAFTRLDKGGCSQGVLAELWGLTPMSEATTAMLQPHQ